MYEYFNSVLGIVHPSKSEAKREWQNQEKKTPPEKTTIF